MAKQEEKNEGWEEDSGDLAPFWKPEKEGDTLEGKIVEIRDGKFGKIFTIEKEDGSEIATPSHKMLQNRLGSRSKGDMVKIVYEGRDIPTVKGQNGMEKYKTFHKSA